MPDALRPRPPTPPAPSSLPDPDPTLAEAAGVWARIGLMSFGGPAGQIALMHRVLVEERRWIDDARFLHALNFCMLLPGPEAMQLATYVGWLKNGVRGGVVAGVLFLLPGALVILALSAVYAAYGQVPLVASVFFGLKAAVLALVAQAVARLVGRVLGRPALVAVAGAAFLALVLFGVPFPVVVLGAALIGGAAARAFRPAPPPPPAVAPLPSARGAVWAGIAALALWLAPVGLLLALAGPANVFAAVAVFFSKLAVLTFGGAYAALAWVAQEAVASRGWLAPGEMLDGLGLAETTPGPLILVLEFVGFLTAFRDPGGLAPLLAGGIGALVAVWVTFAPSFALVFLGAPYVERLRQSPRLAAALAAVTAAVVGVVLNLALWFALHVVFARTRELALGPLSLEVPVWGSVDPWAAILVVAALVAVFRFRAGLAMVLGGAGAAGLLLGLAGTV